MQAISAGDHQLVEIEIRLGDTLHLGRVVVHEEVADLIEGAVVDGHEIPFGPGFHQADGGGMGGEGLGEFLGEVQQALILRLIDGVAFGHEEAEDLVGIDLEGADAEVVEVVSQFEGPVGAGGGQVAGS